MVQARSALGRDDTDADNWGDLVDPPARDRLRATDYRKPERFCRGIADVPNCRRIPQATLIQWGTVAPKARRRRLAAWLQMRHSERIAASFGWNFWHFDGNEMS